MKMNRAWCVMCEEETVHWYYSGFQETLEEPGEPSFNCCIECDTHSEETYEEEERD